MRRFLAIALSAVMAGTVCVFAACGGGGNSGNSSKDSGGSTVTEPEKLVYVSMDINPEIELIVDKDNNVVSVRGGNEDGLVLLYEESGIEGAKIDEAVKKITDLAVKYGYLDENNKVIETIVSSGDSDFAAEILSKVNTSVTATAKNSGLTVATDGEGAFSLLRKMEEVKKQFPNNSAIQNMSLSKFKLALSVSETGELTIDAAAVLDDAELIEMLKDVTSDMEDYATDAYVQAKKRALATFEQATALQSYSVYMPFYLEKMSEHLLTSYYGGVYQMYASSATGFGLICDFAELETEYKNFALTEEQVAPMVAALGSESADALKDSQGITLNSVEVFADKLFKNTPASEALEQTKIALNEALTQAENVLKTRIAELVEAYRTQYTQTLATARNTITSVSAQMGDLVKSVFSTATKDLEDILDKIDAILAGEEIDLVAMRKEANKLQTKADEYLEKIKADLSAAEWNELQKRAEAAVENFVEYKTAFENALDEAAQTAKAYLKDLKEKRLSK